MAWVPAFIVGLAALTTAGATESVGYELPNGLRVYLEPRPGSPSVAGLLTIPAGRVVEAEDERGLAHFVEHMAFTGTRDWSEAELKGMIDGRGGSWNGETGPFETQYYAHLPAEDVSILVEWLAEVAFHPSLEADQLAAERSVLMQELGGPDPLWLDIVQAMRLPYSARREEWRALFAGSRLGAYEGDMYERIAAVSIDDVRRFHHAWYGPGGAVLVLVGGFDVAAAAHDVEVHFGAVPVGSSVATPSVTGAPRIDRDGTTLWTTWSSDQMPVRVAARVPGRSHEDHWPLVVLFALLERRLFERLRYDDGLAYSIDVDDEFFVDSGIVSIHAEVEARHADEALAQIRRAIDEIRRGEIDDAVVDDAKRAIRGNLAVRHGHNLSRARFVTDVLRAGRSVGTELDALDAVRAADVVAVADHLAPENTMVIRARAVVASPGAFVAGGLLVGAVGFERRRRRRSG